MDTDLLAAFGRLDGPRAEGTFEVKTRSLPIHRQKDAPKAKARAMRRKLIRPENAEAILDAMPRTEGDRLHVITGGEFIFGDLVAMLCQRRRPAEVALSTLSMSNRNVESLLTALETREIGRLFLLVSHYFAKTNTEIFVHLENAVSDHFRLAIARTQAKVSLFDFGTEKLVIEASANLRSSDNIEQISAFADADLWAWHREWIIELIEKPETNK